MARSKNLAVELQKARKEAWPPTIAFFRWAEQIKTTPSETTTADLRETLAISASDAKELIDGIRELKLAEFIVGRKSFPSRLRWLYTLPSIAKTANGTATAPTAIASSVFSQRNIIKHSFRLRPEEVVTFDLPEDLTLAEADRLSKFILTLPFNSQ